MTNRTFLPDSLNTQKNIAITQHKSRPQDDT